jgi:Domain of unknown function (DUF4350)
MQHRLAPGDRNLLILAGVLIAAMSAAAVIFSPQETRSLPGLASSYSASNDGAKAAYLWLEQMGYRVERWVDPPEDLPGVAFSGLAEDRLASASNTILILAQPLMPASAEEKTSLANFVRQGGCVLIAGARPGILVPEGLIKTASFSNNLTKAYPSEIPAPLTRDVPEIQMAAHTRWPRLSGHQLRYYGDSDGATVVSFTLGKGEVKWWADPGPLTNAGISQSSNSMLLLNSIGPPENARILWDEYYHGYRAGFWSYLGRTPVPWSLIQVALILIAALVTYGRRRVPLRSLRQESRLSPLEFVETLGDLYRQRGGAAEALEIAYQRFRFLLSKRLGLPTQATSEEISRRVRDQLGWVVPGFSETVLRCDLGVKNPHLTGAQSLQLIQELHDYMRRFGLGRPEIAGW